jgi:hypothetical protein
MYGGGRGHGLRQAVPAGLCARSAGLVPTAVVPVSAGAPLTLAPAVLSVGPVVELVWAQAIIDTPARRHAVTAVCPQIRDLRRYRMRGWYARIMVGCVLNACNYIMSQPTAWMKLLIWIDPARPHLRPPPRVGLGHQPTLAQPQEGSATLSRSSRRPPFQAASARYDRLRRIG